MLARLDPVLVVRVVTGIKPAAKERGLHANLWEIESLA